MHFKSDLERLNHTLQEQFKNANNSPMLNIARMITGNLRGGPLEPVIPEIVGGMKLNVSQYYWDHEREAVTTLVNTMAEGITLLYYEVREFLSVDEALRFIVANSSGFTLTIE